MANLPTELINEILVVLPLKSLVRFRCVSKSFYTMIDSQDFIYGELCSSSEKRLHRKLIFKRMVKNNGLDFISYDVNDRSVEKVRSDLALSYANFAASCNGLVLLYSSDIQYYVWNPSTGKYKELPAFPSFDPACPYNPSFHCGFGYDSTTNDYKIIQIVCTGSCCEVWIFELRSSCRRKLQNIPYIDNTEIRRVTVTSCCGYVYMLCYGRESNIIVAFDVAKETYSVIPQPIFEYPTNDKRLDDFEGCLSLMVFAQNKFDLYVRKKERVEFTWTKLLSVVKEHFYPITLGYTKEGDKVLFFRFGNKYLYDLNERRLEKIETSPLIKGSALFMVCV